MSNLPSSSKPSRKRSLKALATVLATVLATLGMLALGAVLLAVSGRVEVAAEARHSGLVEWFLETARHRAVERQTARVEVPTRSELADPARQRRGEGLYRQHCAVCHGQVGEPRSAVADGLNPPPPDLSHGIPQHDAAEAWWVTARGIRMTGMPAFGEHLSSEVIWDVVAWLTADTTRNPPVEVERQEVRRDPDPVEPDGVLE